MTKPFDPTKPVQLRDGTPARIIATDIKNSNYPIVAACTSENGEEYCETFTSEGKFLHGSTKDDKDDMDLVNVPEVPVVVATTYTSLCESAEFGYSYGKIEDVPTGKGWLGVVKVDLYSDGSFTVEKVK